MSGVIHSSYAVKKYDPLWILKRLRALSAEHAAIAIGDAVARVRRHQASTDTLRTVFAMELSSCALP